MQVLCGDIGGTKTHLAIFRLTPQLQCLAENIYPSSQYATLETIIQDFTHKHAITFEQACFGIAGPVEQNNSLTTNLPWQINGDQLSTQLGLKKVLLINDLEATAWGVNALKTDDVLLLNPGKPNAKGNASIIAAGTGLGEAGLYWDGAVHRPFATEGGHSSFAPGNALEMELLTFMLQRHEHVSWERIVSGMGLLNLYEFLCHYRQASPPQWLAEAMRTQDPAAVISQAALNQRCKVCVETLDLFARLYAAEAGNQALKLMSTGGIYIGGGIAPKILPKLKEPVFLQTLQHKGRMSSLVADMPVKVILNPRTALYGPAVYLLRNSPCAG